MPVGEYPPGLPEAYHEVFDERAAVREFDGGFPRDEAEKLALEDVRRIWMKDQNKDWPWQS